MCKQLVADLEEGPVGYAPLLSSVHMEKAAAGLY